MNPVKLSLAFLLCLIPFALSAQRTISGRITDAEDGSPIVGASVFISNTTVGIATDANGEYRFPIPGEGSYRLVISHVGYETVYEDIEPGKTSVVLDIAMKMATIEEVTVTAKASFRKKDVDLFWKTILGKKPTPKTIYATNPDDVYYYYNTETQMLTVTCRVPLQIFNKETGYQIQYVLNHFKYDYNLNLSSWEGQYMFTELDPVNYRQKNTWEKNRKKIYSVSIANFIRTLFHDSSLENGFLLACRKTGADRAFNLTDPEIFLSADSDDGGKTMQIPPDYTVMLVCFGKPVTGKDLLNASSQKPWEYIGLFRNKIQTPADPVRIFPDGTYRNQLGVSPIFSSRPFSGLDMLLPVDYLPDAASGMRAEVVAIKDEPLSVSPLVDTLIRYAKRFDHQLSIFPQEKIHLHTDKPYYLSGERIWFRAHVVDAAKHVPTFSPNCVFVELFNAKDSVVSRIKTGSENNLYSGYINIPEDAPEGDYTIRAYTAGMRNLEEDYFFMKTIRIGDPISRMIQSIPEFEFLSDKKIGAGIRFSSISPISPTMGRPQGYAPTTVSPESLKISINDGKPANLKSVNGRASLSFDLPSTEKQRVMLLDAMFNKTPFRQYIRIPLPDDDFDVSFYPEGGSALYGCAGRIAFKAMQRDGTEIDVEGTVYDSHGNELGQFKTDMRGMGQFRLIYEPGKTYYAICTNSKGQSKRFELPAAKTDGYALTATWGKDQLIVNVNLTPNPSPQERGVSAGDTLCLIVHTRGMVQDVLIWEDTGAPVYFQKDFFPSGVSNLLLLTKDMIPVSERLVFAYNDDQAKVECRTDRDVYPAKSAVEYEVNITDESGESLRGNFSVSVTDDHVVAPDTISNILTSFLLTSDLRGNIPDPAYYFRKTGQSSVYALDLLMLTQGWRRYDAERIVKNDFIYPDTTLSKGYDLSGTVRTIIGWRPVANARVNILSMKGNFTEETITDSKGRFFLPDGEAPDSTWLMVQTELPKSDRLLNYELILDDESYPERLIPVVAAGSPDRVVLAQYADKEEQRYVEEHGARVRQIEEVVISAPRIYSKFYDIKNVQFSITDKDIEKFPPANISHLLMRIPGLRIEGNKAMIGIHPPKIVVNTQEWDIETILYNLHIREIGQIEVLPGRFAGLFSTFDGEQTVIIINTKFIPKPTPYIKHIMPLGFQKPAEFYAPKYDTPTRTTKPDLRTTIHWAPNITTDEEGRASFSFSTADTPTTYSVVIEGVTENGKIVYHRDKLTINN